MSVNVSPKQFRYTNVSVELAAALRATALAPARVVVEVKAVLIEDAARRHADRLRDMGDRIALDDFGTGFLSLC